MVTPTPALLPDGVDETPAPTVVFGVIGVDTATPPPFIEGGLEGFMFPDTPTVVPPGVVAAGMYGVEVPDGIFVTVLSGKAAVE